MEFQIRNWGCFRWLYGDNIVEQHVHNIDIANWVMAKDGDPKKAHPVEANGMGGRVNRGNYGDIFDHHFVEFTYADGTKMFSQCRHIPARGTGQRVRPRHEGQPQRRPTGGGPKLESGNPYVQEHVDLIKAIRKRRAAQRGLVRRRQQHDGRAGPHGHLLGPSRQVGRRRGQGPAGSPRADRLGRQPRSLPGENGFYPFAIPGVSPLF